MKCLTVLAALFSVCTIDLTLSPSVAQAQYNARCGDTGCARCCTHSPDPESTVVNQGAFIAPQPVGEVQGESNSVGIRFGSFRIPSVTIEMPTFQLPSLVRYRREAQMVTESGVAPYHTRGLAEFDLNPHRPERAAPDNRDKETGPAAPGPTYCPPAPGCTTTMQQHSEQRIRELESQIVELNATMKQMAEIQLHQLKQQQQLNNQYQQTQYQASQQPQDFSNSSNNTHRNSQNPVRLESPSQSEQYPSYRDIEQSQPGFKSFENRQPIVRSAPQYYQGKTQLIQQPSDRRVTVRQP